MTFKGVREGVEVQRSQCIHRAGLSGGRADVTVRRSLGNSFEPSSSETGYARQQVAVVCV